MIKPHPKELNTKGYRKLSSKYSRVSVLSKRASLYKAINGADIVVVNSSTVGLEAMLWNKVVLVLEMNNKISNGSKRYFNSKLLGELAQSDEIKLVNVLGSIITDKKMINYTNKKREKFLSSAYPMRNQLSGKLLVKLIQQLI